MEQASKPAVPAAGADVCTFIFPRRGAAKCRIRAEQTSKRSTATPKLQITSSSSQDIVSLINIQFPVISPQSSELPACKNGPSESLTSQSSTTMATSSSSDTFGTHNISDQMGTIITEQTCGVLIATERQRSSSASGAPPQLQSEESTPKRGPGPLGHSIAAGTDGNISLHKRNLAIGTKLLPAFEDEVLAPRSNRSSWFTVSAYCRDDNTNTPGYGTRTDYSPSVSSTEYLSEGSSLTKKSLTPDLAPLLPSSHSTGPNVAPDNQMYTNNSHLAPPAVLPSGKLRNRAHFPQVKESATTVRVSSSEAVEYAKTIEIQLWIDQEEHRTIRPRFIFRRHTPRGIRSGISPHRTHRPTTAQSLLSFNVPDSKKRFWDHVTELGLVDFRMPEQEIGTFHCGKISREAVIRRLVVNEKDEKDFLSQNITLPLKQNGVYAVYGSEPDRGDRSKRYVWKFEYTIEPKGVARSNEKLLRPLSFICSPELLAPSQAMTVTIFHILSKAVVHSPTAKRVPPPSMPPVPGHATGSDFSYGSDSSCASQFSGGSRIAGTVRSFGRPTTPQKDVRLWASGTTGRRSLSSRRGSLILAKDELTLVKRSKSAEGRERRPRRVDTDLGSGSTRHEPPRGEIGSFRSIGDREYKYYKSELPHVLRKKDISSKRPHTAGSPYVQVRKEEGDRTIVKPPPRPATAVPSSSSLKSVTRLGRIAWDATFKPHRAPKTTDSRISSSTSHHIARDQYHPSAFVGGMPSREDVDQMLASMKAVIIQEQQRLEMALHRNSSKEKAAIERLDSETDIKFPDETSTPSLNRSPLLGMRIVPTELLEAWITPSSSDSSRRPSTAQGSSAPGTFHNSSSRSTGSMGFNRPHTSAGYGEVKKLLVYSQPLDSLRASLSLPAPPRRSPRRLLTDPNPKP